MTMYSRTRTVPAGAQPATHQWEDLEVLLREMPRVETLTDASLGHARVNVLRSALRRHLDRA
jgi:hypothetical protein